MSMSTHIVGFKPADEKWNKMKAVWDTCEKAGTSIPDEVIEFFGGENPKDKPGMEVSISGAYHEHNAHMVTGYEVDIDLLPKDVKFIRFYNSY